MSGRALGRTGSSGAGRRQLPCSVTLRAASPVPAGLPPAGYHRPVNRAAVGTLAWELRTGGRLDRLDRVRLLASALQARLARRLRALGRPAYAREARRVASIDIDGLRIPDTRAAREALAACHEASPDFLVNHCLRTYLFGALLARGLRYDEELLYAASLLHDLGLTAATSRHDADTGCFAVAGARQAHDLSVRWDWSNPRRDRLREAITLHLNVTVPPRQGAEAHLLHAGAAADVVGARFREIPSDHVGAVLAAHPRAGFKEGLRERMRIEARLRPDGRTAFLARHGFFAMIERAPFAD